ncbi:MAG: PIN domain-containing protein [Acidimicrobiia bacterium]
MAVASLDASHEAHTVCREALLRLKPALAGHAAFETFAVLTRMPPPARIRPSQASEVLRLAFPERCWLSVDDSEKLWRRLADLELAGGSIYDAMIGAAARGAGRKLLTRDRRAVRVYRAVGADHVLVE